MFPPTTDRPLLEPEQRLNLYNAKVGGRLAHILGFMLETDLPWAAAISAVHVNSAEHGEYLELTVQIPAAVVQRRAVRVGEVTSYIALQINDENRWGLNHQQHAIIGSCADVLKDREGFVRNKPPIGRLYTMELSRPVMPENFVIAA